MITSKISSAGTTTLDMLSKLANQHQAIDLLTHGDVEFDCPDELIQRVEKFMKKGLNDYTPTEGALSLREVIAQKPCLYQKYNINPEKEITITSGARQAVFTAISAFVRENDEVIIFEPACDNYAPVVRLNGGIPVYIQLKRPDYYIDWTEVTRSITSRTRMIIINTPHDATGSILSALDIEKLNKLLIGSNIIVLSDETHQHIIYDETDHQTVARFPQLWNRSLVVSSFGKSLNINGWKIGYCIAPVQLMDEFRKYHQLIMGSVNAPIQYALAEYLQNIDHFAINDLYQKKRDLILKGLKSSRFKITPSTGTYYQLLDYSAISNEKDRDFAERLIKEHGVAVMPVSAFYHQKNDYKVVRICFAKSKQILEQGIEKLIKI